MFSPLSLLIGWLLDLSLGDPRRLPHPIVWFGRMIAFGERRLNCGRHRRAKGAAMAVGLILFVFVLACAIRYGLSFLPRTDTDLLGLSLLPRTATDLLGLSLRPESVPVRVSLWLIFFDAIVIFYCLAGTTLIREVRAVFLALDRSLEEGRAQVARIVGRDTSQLSAQEVRTAALETLAENLSDGVIAPLFWLLLLGTPGMLAYKMVNTLDSMIGYRTDRYRDFGCWAARLDDAANYIPARLTALLMVIASPLALATSLFTLHLNSSAATPAATPRPTAATPRRPSPPSSTAASEALTTTSANSSTSPTSAPTTAHSPPPTCCWPSASTAVPNCSCCSSRFC